MVTRQIPSGLSSVLFHICKTRFVGWISSLLTYLLGKTFTVAPQSIWNLMGFSLISICAYISRSETLLTVPVISGFEITQYRNSSSLVSSSSNSTLCVFSLALHWDAKWFFFHMLHKYGPKRRNWFCLYNVFAHRNHMACRLCCHRWVSGSDYLGRLLRVFALWFLRSLHLHLMDIFRFLCSLIHILKLCVRDFVAFRDLDALLES